MFPQTGNDVTNIRKVGLQVRLRSHHRIGKRGDDLTVGPTDLDTFAFVISGLAFDLVERLAVQGFRGVPAD